MLEEEGVDFGLDGKIHSHCFVNEVSVVTSVASAAASLTTTKSVGSGSATKKISKTRKRDYDDTTTCQHTQHACSTKKKTSKYFNSNDITTSIVSESTLKQEILDLLSKRQPGKTC